MLKLWKLKGRVYFNTVTLTLELYCCICYITNFIAIKVEWIKQNNYLPTKTTRNTDEQFKITAKKNCI